MSTLFCPSLLKQYRTTYKKIRCYIFLHSLGTLYCYAIGTVFLKNLGSRKNSQIFLVGFALNSSKIFKSFKKSRFKNAEIFRRIWKKFNVNLKFWPNLVQKKSGRKLDPLKFFWTKAKHFPKF